MKVLSLTHAHLNPEGLSPVSCERADSIVGTWGERLNWEVDVVHTNGTKWRGIWPRGEGLKINIIEAAAPEGLLIDPPVLFSGALQEMLAKKQFSDAFSFAGKRIAKRTRTSLADNGFALPHDIAAAKKWGRYLSGIAAIGGADYDFIFVCVGYGDEYLLQTALTLSKSLNVPMIADFRDLWSEHHVPHRFTPRQRKQIHRLEKKLLVNTALISAPQKHMVALLRKWADAPVYLLSHSAHMEDTWEDARVNSAEFTMLYAGKLYADGPGLAMLLELVRQVSQAKLYRPFKCHFFVENTELLKKLVGEYGIAACVSINEWIAPSQLWGKMRSANVLVVPDPGVAAGFPFLPTKTFQYAHTGRQVLSLSPGRNEEMEEFLTRFNAGKAFTNVGEALKWITGLSFEKSQYEALPPLREVPMRADAAVAFGKEIEKIIGHG